MGGLPRGCLQHRKEVSDLKVVRENVNCSDCIFLCISGEYLQQPIADRVGDVMEDADINRMPLFIKDLPPIPLVIMITKADLIQHRSSEDIVNDIKRLFDLCFREEKRLIMVCPVSIIQPMNLELPFIFTAHAALKKKIGEVKTTLEADKEQLERWTRGLAGLFRDVFQSVKVDVLRSRVAQCRNELEQLKTRLRPLSMRLEKVSVFYGGRSIKIDDEELEIRPSNLAGPAGLMQALSLPAASLCAGLANLKGSR